MAVDRRSDGSAKPWAPSRRARDAGWVVGVALAARAVVVAWAARRFPAAEDGHYYDTLARRLAAGTGYTWAWPDGTVTYASHYPVGYPAILAVAYRAFGAWPGVAMGANALLGAAGAWAAHSLMARGGAGRARSLGAGLAVALHPALVPYTAALMTEGVTAALWMLAAALGERARGSPRPWPWRVGAGAALGLAILVRPPSLLLAPVVGALAAGPAGASPGARGRRRLPRGRWVSAAAVTAVALACVLPWTVRNCVRMQRCALVSVNGGWNLLIGARTTSGTWEPLVTPPECATVWSEAAKDACFEAVARRAIADAPGRWLGLVPAKLASTFDYFGAAPWYLHSSNGAAFGDGAKLALGAVETAACRLFLVGALVACARLRGPRIGGRRAIAAGGALAAIGVHAWIGYAALVACVASLGPRAWAKSPAIAPMAAAVVAATAAVHAVFFGAGRYGLVVAPFVAVLAFVGAPSPTSATETAGGTAEAAA